MMWVSQTKAGTDLSVSALTVKLLKPLFAGDLLDFCCTYCVTPVSSHGTHLKELNTLKCLSMISCASFETRTFQVHNASVCASGSCIAAPEASSMQPVTASLPGVSC